MLSSLSEKLSVLQTSSEDNLARQKFRGFKICTEKLGIKNKGVSKFTGFRGTFWFAGRLNYPGGWILNHSR